MKKITKEEQEALKYKISGSPLRNELHNMKAGEILQIDFKDYPHTWGPYYIMRRIEKATGRQFEMSRLAANAGWVVERMK